MPVYSSDSEFARGLQGLHLFHFTFSNCSQRVRLALAEKQLSWISHHLDLSKNEHVTPEYQAINPKGVVPTLVNDGEVVVESNDILRYLETLKPDPALVPQTKADCLLMDTFIELAGKSQDAIKTISFNILLRDLIGNDERQLKFLQENRNNKDIVQFMEDFHDDSEAWSIRVNSADEEMLNVLGRLDCALIDRPWLSGDHYGLADISWVVNIHRLCMAGYNIKQYTHLQDWYLRTSSRKSFSDAVVNYQPPLNADANLAVLP